MPLLFYLRMRRTSLGLLCSFLLNLRELLLELQSFCAQTAVSRAKQPSVDSAVMLDRANASRRQAQRNGPAQNFGRERTNLQVRLPTAARLVVGMADVVAEMRLCAADRTYTRHNFTAGNPPRLQKALRGRFIGVETRRSQAFRPKTTDFNL